MLPEQEQHILDSTIEIDSQDVESQRDAIQAQGTAFLADIEDEFNALFASDVKEASPQSSGTFWFEEIEVDAPQTPPEQTTSPQNITNIQNFIEPASDEAFDFDNLFNEEPQPLDLPSSELDFNALFTLPDVQDGSLQEDLVASTQSTQIESSSEFVETPEIEIALDSDTNQPEEILAHVSEVQTDENSSESEYFFAQAETVIEFFPTVEDATSIDNQFNDSDALLEDEAQAVASAPTTDEFDDLDALLEAETPASDEEFDALDALLEDEAQAVASAPNTDEFDDLDALLEAETPASDEFDDLDALLEPTPQKNVDEFADLDSLLDENVKQLAPTNKTELAAPRAEKPQAATTKPPASQSTVIGSRKTAFEQTMRVPVKHLDDVGNLVGELVVNRNSLEQDQQRLRQFTENLLHRVQQLNELGVRMQELYERSLLETSLISSRQGSSRAVVDTNDSERHATGMDFDALEMDRFTGFHTLSQEMIEMIVRVRESASDIEFVTDETEVVARQFRQVTTQLQEGITRSRMIPFSQIADRLPRAVKEITLKYGKQAELEIEGRDTLIDKVILEQLYDPMTHLVNNSITHGIETPEERIAKGKPAAGKITIRAFHQGNQTVISVSDDGAGIDPDRVLTKAIQKGLITVAEARTMSRMDVYNLLFHPGFSTKEQVDEFAGRGVGMDVVRTSLNEIRGTINTDSVLGKGTTFTIRLPLTLSICKALSCLSDKARIAFPMDGVEDMMDIPESSLVIEEDKPCVAWRDSVLPLRPLKELISYNRVLGRGNVYGSSRGDDLISVVILRSAGTYLALQVDQVLGEQEIVIKQFEAPVPKPVGIAGATILGDGRVMPIADVLELIDLALGRIQHNDLLWTTSATPLQPEMQQDTKSEPTVLIVDDSITVRELLSMTFNKAGYRVEQARDGQEAWDKLRDGLPCDLIFCDIEMPRMDGLELLSRLQKDLSLSEIPIAMLTSRGAERHRQMAIQLGASGYFTKPYLEEVLLEGAAKMLNGEMLVASS